MTRRPGRGVHAHRRDPAATTASRGRREDPSGALWHARTTAATAGPGPGGEQPTTSDDAVIAARRAAPPPGDPSGTRA